MTTFFSLQYSCWEMSSSPGGSRHVSVAAGHGVVDRPAAGLQPGELVSDADSPTSRFGKHPGDNVCTLKFEKLCSTLQKFISFTVGSALQNHDILEVQSRPSESPSWWKGVTVP